MPLDLTPFADAGLTRPVLETLISRHERITMPRLSALWGYYRNPLKLADAAGRGPSSRPYTLAQEQGLPPRLLGRATGPGNGLPDDRSWKRKEVVIENDIAWRIHTMIDFMFGRPIAFASSARDERLARRIERVLDAVWEASGGAALLQDLALLAHVYGHVDLLVRAMPGGEAVPADADGEASGALLDAAKSTVRVEVIDPIRGMPLLSTSDYRRMDAYIIRSRREVPATDAASAASAAASASAAAGAIMRRWLGKPSVASEPVRTVVVTEIISAATRAVHEFDEGDERAGVRLLEEGPALVGEPRSDEHDETRGGPPIVHIQNIAQPLAYEGLGEVEPLIPLQDELNTRLSDRASRVTMQSFKMFLAKGLDGLDRLPVGPGQVVLTSNPEATIETFGGDASSPSEDAHIAEIREALDKVSGVPPLAAGVVRAKIGNLSSANALRVTLMGLLSRTARKRITYGRGLVEASRMVLDALDRAGILRTDPRDRDLRVVWPDPLPPSESDALIAAERKLAIGVPRQQVLAELGYGASDPGVA
jgi:hypothetical protein